MPRTVRYSTGQSGADCRNCLFRLGAGYFQTHLAQNSRTARKGAMSFQLIHEILWIFANSRRDISTPSCSMNPQKRHVMEILEKGEIWEQDNFSRTVVILRDKFRFYQAFSTERMNRLPHIDTLERSEFPANIWPLYKENDTLTIASIQTHEPSSYFVKIPSLLTCSTTTDNSGFEKVRHSLIREARIYEILSQNSHPNIAKYMGCLVSDERIVGLCLLKYAMTLAERCKIDTLFDDNEYIRQIQEGIKHPHSLGFVHNDIKPANIMVQADETLVIIDFDSCGRIGDKLGVKAGTESWTDSTVVVSEEQNDYFGLEKIKEWLSKQKSSIR
jgi:serine/threonine protein kinase